MLHAVAGIVEEGDISPFDLDCEPLDGLLHGEAICIERNRGIETEPCEGSRDVLCIIAGVGECGHISISRIANDECDPGFSMSLGRCEKRVRQRQENNEFLLSRLHPPMPMGAP